MRRPALFVCSVIGSPVPDPPEPTAKWALQGDQGEPGVMGENGAMGSPGATGAKGAMGSPGATGAMGLPGAMGAIGLPGVIGAMGLPGDIGPTGDTGATGDPGPAGSYMPRAWVACDVTLDLLAATGLPGTDGVKETAFGYRVTAYTNHDAEVGCSAALGAKDSTSASDYYPGTTNGASSLTCLLSLDYPPAPASNGTAGSWKFRASTGGPTATYSDPDPNTLNGFKYTFVENDCNGLFVGSDGTWQPASLADLFP
jgi:Collagen triple helix repeat (20 copies)